MNDAVRILAVAPYEGMQSLIRKVVDTDYPQVELDVVVGDLEKGVEVAQNNFHADYDVIISRGGTAQLLREKVALPVLEIPITEYDLLRALRLAEGVSDRYALVGYASITSNANILAELLPLQLSTFTIHNSASLESVMNQVLQAGHQTVLCDMVATTAAKQLGLNAILITSGADSIRKALDSALLLCRSLRNLQSENHFLREVIHGQSNETVVFDEQKNLYFSTVDAENRPAVLQMLKNEIDNIPADAPARIVKSLDGTLYTIKSQKLDTAGKAYTTFYFSRSKAPLSSARSGIRYYTCQEALNSFYNGFYSITGAINGLEKEIQQLNQSNRPVMLLGEEGTGKEPVASILYTRSTLKNHPMVSINCMLLNDKTWDFLQSSHNSPFTQSETTIFIYHLMALTPEQRRQLLAALVEMDVCRRNRVIFSCVCPPDEVLPAAAQDFVEPLCCVKLHLPPLRRQAERIPTLVTLYLGQLNVTQAREILGMEPAAMQLMQSFPWPHNYSQIKRVIQELVTTAEGSTISYAAVQKVLKLERTSPVAQSAVDLPMRFDLNRTLEEMDRELIQRVLAECGGNQTAAAKRLGISRTTLWRFCKG